MSTNEVSEDEIPVSVEDKFVVFAFGKGRSLCPHSNDTHHLGGMLSRLNNIVPIFDLRGLEGYYNDVDQLIRNIGGEYSYVILGGNEIDAGWDHELTVRGLKTIQAKGQASGTTLIHKSLFGANPAFADEASKLLQLNMHLATINPSHKYIKNLAELEWSLQFDKFSEFITSNHRNSLLLEFVMAAKGESIVLCPYHGNAIHNVETKGNTVLVGRPAVIARNTRAVFYDETTEFERLINEKTVKEHHVQKFLERNPNFLKGLNYQNIYPQLVLERDDDGALIPDFILEPFDGAFCDILDIKLPKQKLLVGGKDRGQLAAGLHEVAAQLREYAAYFEQEKYRQFVRDKYGLKVYRPRLIAVIGRDIMQMTEEQFRRAMTAYDNLQFMTFDELLLHAKNRLLV